jgi:hypothetical protein
MTTTPELIDALVACTTPVRRLRPPLLRVALWLVFAVFIMAILAVLHGLRSDLGERLQDHVFLIRLTAGFATGVLASIAAFMVSLPDRSRVWLIVPAPALLVWVSVISYGCLTDWVAVGPDGIRAGEAMRCFATLLMTSLPLAITLLVMLRYAALLRVGPVSLMGSMAIAGMAATALSLLHDLDASAMILLWNLGTAGLLVTLGSLFGRRLFWLAASHVSHA